MSEKITMKEIIDNELSNKLIEFKEDGTYSIISDEVEVYFEKANKLVEMYEETEDDKLMEKVDSLGYSKKEILIILAFIILGVFDLIKEEYIEEFSDAMRTYFIYLEEKNN